MDYAPVDTILSFSASMTTDSFDVSLINDGSVEGDETLTMRLASVTNIMFFPSDRALVTILDDDSEQLTTLLLLAQKENLYLSFF